MFGNRLGAWLVLGLAGAMAASACGRAQGQSGSADGADTAVGGETSMSNGAAPPMEVEAGSGGVSGDSAEAGAPPQFAGDGGGGGGHAGDGSGGTAPFDPCSLCALDQVCQDQVCLDIVCQPGSTFCQDGAIWQCDAQGIAPKLAQTCATDEFCIAQGKAAQCGPTQCLPDEAMCVGHVATHCLPDGSAPKPGGQDCSKAGEVCSDGECVTQACTPGSKLCQHEDVYFCDKNGTKTTLFEACEADEACDPALGQCRHRICTPGTLSCDGDRVTSCDALGLLWQQSGPDCGATNRLCVSGSCKPKLCQPNVTYCDGEAVYTCDALGVAPVLKEQCAATQHCVFYSNYAYCATNQCVPNTPYCSGNTLTTCLADGSGPAPGGTPCKTKEVCSAGSCVPQVCEPYNNFCKGNIGYACYYDGLQSYPLGDCGPDATCVDKTHGYECKQHYCVAGKGACIGNQLGTCAADGFALESVSANCAASGQVCNVDAQCVAGTTDTWGKSEDLRTITTDYLVGDAVEVLSSRTLTQLEANVVLPAARALTWTVYERNDSYFVRKYSTVTTAEAGSGYQSSGAISYVLQAGKAYLLALSATGGGIAPYVDTAPTSSATSFGHVLGGIRTYKSDEVNGYSHDPELLYDLRITTAP